VGAPGRTTVAIELAVALARLGGDSLIVDMDTMGPSVAQLLGLIDDTSGLAAAVRAAARGAIEPEVLASMAVAVPAGPRVLVGLPSPERWTELRPASTAAVLQCARGLVPWTVVDLGSCIEGSDLDWVEPGTPQRFGAARTALVDADIVLCVGRTDPIGLTRMLRELPKVRALAPTADVRLVLNRTRGRAGSRRAIELVSGVIGQPAIELLDDPRNVERAVARGCPVSEVAPTSALVTGIERLARELLPDAGSYHQGRDGAARTHRRFLRGTHRRDRRRNAGVV
jgi:MinD-like ATPase involved in chromosome partitioning or flagellar assembly